MASGPYDATYPADAGPEVDAPRERSLGEHVFIWIGWALAAAFWGATTTTIMGILGAANHAVEAPSAPGLPGGMAYLALVVVAFVLVALSLLYAQVRTARGGRLDLVSEAGAAALYDRAERQGGEDLTGRSPDCGRSEGEFR